MTTPESPAGIVVDPDELGRVINDMGAARGAFDSCAASMPDPAGTGWAEELIASILSAVVTAAGEVLVESEALSGIADRCGGDYGESDTNAAIDLLLSGDHP